MEHGDITITRDKRKVSLEANLFFRSFKHLHSLSHVDCFLRQGQLWCQQYFYFFPEGGGEATQQRFM